MEPPMNTQLVQSLVQVIRSLNPEEQALLRQQLAELTEFPPSDHPLSLSQRKAFLRRSLSDRRQLLAQQAEALLSHYQNDSEWREQMAGDIIDV
jgi:hypothetical protein